MWPAGIPVSFIRAQKVLRKVAEAQKRLQVWCYRLWGGKSYCVCVSMSGTTIVKGRFAQKIDMHTLRIHFPPASNYFFHHTHAHSITSHKTLSTPKDQSVTEIWHKQLFPSACEENPGRSSHRQSRDATDLAKSDDFRLFFSLCPTNVQLRS